MKKKILIIVLALVLVGGVIASAILIPKMKYAKDSADTEEFYRQNIALVGYENTIETAIAQTELYNVIKEHFNSPLAEGKTEKKAIIIGYDGCRADVLREMQAENSAINSLLDDGASINLAYCGGVNYPAENTQMTSTAPGWCSILTGKWADEHKITGNGITKEVEPKTLLTTLTEEKVIDSASFITRWAGHFTDDDATYLEEKAYCEENKLNVSFNKCKNDEASHEYTLNEVSKKDCADFIFVIYEPTDSTGHDYGFTTNNPGYVEAFKTADKYGFETLNAIKSRATYETEDWLIIVTSDHGGFGTGHGHESIQERMTFIVSNKGTNDTVDNSTSKPEENKTETNENNTTTPADTILTREPLKKTYANSPESTTEKTPRWVIDFKIEKLPTKTTYYVNEEFSLDGIVVKAYLDDGTVVDVSDDVTLFYGAPSTATPGTRTVRLEYVDNFNDGLGLHTAKFVITIIEPETTTLADEETAPDTTATITEEATDI